MATIEPLVRPFETPSSSPLPGTGTIPQLTPDAILVVHGSGVSKSGGYSYSYSAEWYIDAKQYEITQNGG